MRTILVLVFLALTLPTHAAAEKESLLTLDEGNWVLFYDLPSRRFRTIRDAYVGRNWQRARFDLEASAAFVRTESARAQDTLALELDSVADRLQVLADEIGSSEITGGQLDIAFARTHWLLAQHYLLLAGAARDKGDHRFAGAYLLASAHHMERTVLWSDERLSKRLARTLDDLREQAQQLMDATEPATRYKSKPIVRAEQTLRELGAFLDRKVWLD